MNQLLEKVSGTIHCQILTNNMKLNNLDDIRLLKLLKPQSKEKNKSKKLFLDTLKTMTLEQRVEALEEKIFDLCFDKDNKK